MYLWELSLTPEQADSSKSMSTVETSVEWVFGEILNYFSFPSYKKILKIETLFGKCIVFVFC